MKAFFSSLRILHHCRDLGVPLRSCPQFIFLVMGVVISATIITTYVVARRYADPEIVIGIVTGLTVFLLIVTQILVRSFEEVVYSKKNESARMKEIIELKDQLVHIALHDLGGAATAIKWGLRSLEGERNLSSQSAGNLVNIIRWRNEQLIELAKSLLLITRIDEKKIVVVKRAVNLSELLSGLTEDFARSAKERGISFSLNMPRSSVTSETDKEQLEEIMRILIFRALAHANKEQGEVKVVLSENADDCAVSVTNNGPELDPDSRAHVFEKLWRETGNKDIAGTSFGLYAVKQLCGLIGASISFTSEPEKTVFSVKIPKNSQEQCF